MKITIEIEKVDDNRTILHVNGFFLDVIADDDGIAAQLFKGEELQTELGFDWGENHRGK
jgi:hypothetical protein